MKRRWKGEAKLFMLSYTDSQVNKIYLPSPHLRFPQPPPSTLPHSVFRISPVVLNLTLNDNISFLNYSAISVSPQRLPWGWFVEAAVVSLFFFLWLTLNNTLTNDISPAMMHQGKAGNEKQEWWIHSKRMEEEVLRLAPLSLHKKNYNSRLFPSTINMEHRAGMFSDKSGETLHSAFLHPYKEKPSLSLQDVSVSV